MKPFDRLESFPAATIPFLGGLLRGESIGWPRIDAETTSQFVRAAASHGVQPLLQHLATTNSTWEAWPDEVRDVFTESTLALAALEIVRRRDLVHVLDALAAGGVRPLLMKGAALAYSHYERPELRPRVDVDFLIPASDLSRVLGSFNSLGYRSGYRPGREMIFGQASFSRREHGILHSYDCHWQFTNRQLLRDVLTYDECARSAVPIPALGPHARALSDPHALLAACVHRFAHHGGSTRLIWLADIQRLSSAMSSSELDSFWALARAKKVVEICADGFRTTEEWFGPLPRTPMADEDEPSSVLLRPLTRAQLLWFDLRSMSSWGERRTLLSQVLFPAPELIDDRTSLPVAYVRRLIRGVGGWIRR